jgi:hypothetical protein
MPVPLHPSRRRRFLKPSPNGPGLQDRKEAGRIVRNVLFSMIGREGSVSFHRIAASVNPVLKRAGYKNGVSAFSAVLRALQKERKIRVTGKGRTKKISLRKPFSGK